MSMDNGMDVSPSWQELKDERDTLASEARGLRQVVNRLGAENREIRAERDALAAHVERMRDVWQRLHLRSPVHVEVLKAYSHVMRDTPTTSLASRDSERMKAWANRLEELAGNGRDNEYSEHAEGMQDAAVETMEEADRLRRQAEGDPS